MPFLDHLEELRWRLVKIIVALMVAIGLTFSFCMSGKYDVLALLITPIEPLVVQLHGDVLANISVHVIGEQ